MAFRKIFGYNKRESVIDGCGRLDVRHLMLLQKKIQFYRRIFIRIIVCCINYFVHYHDSMCDSCMMSIFTRDVVQNVYVQFRSHLNWLRIFFFILYWIAFYLVLYFIVLYNFVFLPLANKGAHRCDEGYNSYDRFLADRTIGRAFATACRLSVTPDTTTEIGRTSATVE